MNRCVMKDQATPDAIRFGFAENFNQGVIVVRVQVIQHHLHRRCRGIEFVDPIAHGFRPVCLGATECHSGRALTRFRFQKEKHLARPAALVFLIASFRLRGSQR